MYGGTKIQLTLMGANTYPKGIKVFHPFQSIFVRYYIDLVKYHQKRELCVVHDTNKTVHTHSHRERESERDRETERGRQKQQIWVMKKHAKNIKHNHLIRLYLQAYIILLINVIGLLVRKVSTTYTITVGNVAPNDSVMIVPDADQVNTST